MPLLDELRNRLSPEYVAYIDAEPDGGEVGDEVLLYGVEDIDERNETFEVRTCLPDYLAIGDDGGGRSVLLRCDESNSVWLCDQGAMMIDCLEPVSDSFATWLSEDCPLPE